MLHAVIMAGGSGTRFWPASTEAKPKQFLALFGQNTMLQNTVERIEPLIPAERILVVTNEKYVDLTARQLPGVPKDNIIGESVGKDTAPCVGAAAAIISERDDDATMAVLPADHLIKDGNAFIEVLQKADKKARRSGALGTIGIKPRHPETGYGYIEFEPDQTSKKSAAQPVVQFREKPDAAAAKEFMEAGNFLWNSGMFVWRASAIISQFKQHIPEIYRQIQKLQQKAGTEAQQETVDRFYHACPSVSIDYGIMERAGQVFVIPGGFGWNDVGDWNAFYELSEKDEHGNAVQADWTVIENGENNLISSRHKKMIALAGVDNMAVVETDNALLICNLDDAQSVKQAVKKMRENKELNRFL